MLTWDKSVMFSVIGTNKSNLNCGKKKQSKWVLGIHEMHREWRVCSFVKILLLSNVCSVRTLATFGNMEWSWNLKRKCSSFIIKNIRKGASTDNTFPTCFSTHLLHECKTVCRVLFSIMFTSLYVFSLVNLEAFSDDKFDFTQNIKFIFRGLENIE